MPGKYAMLFISLMCNYLKIKKFIAANKYKFLTMLKSKLSNLLSNKHSLWCLHQI